MYIYIYIYIMYIYTCSNHGDNKLYLYSEQNIFDAALLLCYFRHHITIVHFFTATYKFKMIFNNFMMLTRE